ncbi:MAG: thiamine pyrophosphate-binding protein [Deltaproteobacteria bacterium]|nr:MAG: thiamine pyrophosphate-binding protein [Deltaproteobacteria bacterium]
MAAVAQVMAKTLKELGVKYIFGVPSGNWVDYMAAIDEVDGLEFILISNEGSGGFMADVCWRLTGSVAACFGTFGPGACNQTTGVCGGYLDRSPMLAFSDEMNDQMLHRTSQMNIDHQTLFKPITKWSTRIAAGKVKETLYKAMQIATSEVPGPVHIGLPAGIGVNESGGETIKPLNPDKIPAADVTVLNKMATAFADAKKPIIALGITSIRADVRAMIIKIIEKFDVPVVLTPMAKGMVPENHPCYAGVLAHALSNLVGVTHQQADLVVGIGYDPVELNYEDWMPKVPLVHIDTAPADLDTKIYTLDCDIAGNLKHSLKILMALDCGKKEWDLKELAVRKEKMFYQLTAPKGKFGPLNVLDGLRAILPEDGIMTCDVGAHLHLIGQHWQTYSPECQLMTNGCSSMGFAIPAAIAAKLSCPERKVCCVVGDGGFYMMAGEMATAMRLGAGIVFILMTDAHLSLISIKQEKKGHDRYGTQLHNAAGGYKSMDTLFGVPVFTARNAEEYDQALKNAFAADSPVIVEVFINTKDYEELVLKGNK